jgi:hypothetical protein
MIIPFIALLAVLAGIAYLLKEYFRDKKDPPE